MQNNSKATSGGYGGIGRKGKDIMLRGEKELAADFSKRVLKLETAVAGINEN